MKVVKAHPRQRTHKRPARPKHATKKASVDNYYIQNVNYIIELKIIGSTILTIIRGMGK